MAEDINVEKIMQEIRDEIKSSGADKIPLSFADRTNGAHTGSGNRLDDAVKYISYNYEVQPPVKVFIKKCIRKVAGFFFLPIVGQQNTLNQNYLYVAEAVVDQRNEIESMKKKIEDLESRIGGKK